LTGGYADAAQSVSISCTIQGSFDPETGRLEAQWAGHAAGAFKDKEASRIDETVAGTLNGVLAGATLSGGWAGGSAYIEDSGQWSATK
jgi:hypothetical protein